MRRLPIPGPATSIVLDDGGTEALVLRHVPLGGQAVRIGSRGEADEQPVRKVHFEHDWYLGETAVTQAQWGALMGVDHPVSGAQFFPGQPNNPVTMVNWEDAQEFCSALQPRVEAGWFARLPTEAEWEAACRAGGRAEFGFGDGLEAAERAAWTFETCEGRARDVQTTPDPGPPHAFGLVGMHGNVAEWCEDWYSSEVGFSVRAVERDPCHVEESRATGEARLTVEQLMAAYDREGRDDLLQGLRTLVNERGVDGLNEELAERAGSPTRVLRGGSWGNRATNATSTYRGWVLPGDRGWDFGFRVCLSPRPRKRSRP